MREVKLAVSARDRAVEGKLARLGYVPIMAIQAT
jgi:hypothetical protein